MGSLPCRGADGEDLPNGAARAYPKKGADGADPKRGELPKQVPVCASERPSGFDSDWCHRCVGKGQIDGQGNCPDCDGSGNLKSWCYVERYDPPSWSSDTNSHRRRLAEGEPEEQQLSYYSASDNCVQGYRRLAEADEQLNAPMFF